MVKAIVVHIHAQEGLKVRDVRNSTYIDENVQRKSRARCVRRRKQSMEHCIILSVGRPQAGFPHAHHFLLNSLREFGASGMNRVVEKIT